MQTVTEALPTTGPLGAREQLKLRRPGEIIAAAFEEFKQNGYASTRLDDVAKRIGVSKGTIYIYFQNKEELFRAVVQSLVAPTLERAAEISAAFEGNTCELLKLHLEAFYDKICINPRGQGLLRLLIAESEKFPELTEFYHREVIARGNQIIGDVLRRGVERGEFRKDAPVDCPQIIVAPVMTLAMHRMLFKDRHTLPVDSYMQSHITMVLNGLRVP